MAYDCGFEKENNWFRYRAAAMIVDSTRSAGKVSVREMAVEELLADGYEVYRKCKD